GLRGWSVVPAGTAGPGHPDDSGCGRGGFGGWARRAVHRHYWTAASVQQRFPGFRRQRQPQPPRPLPPVETLDDVRAPSFPEASLSCPWTYLSPFNSVGLPGFAERPAKSSGLRGRFEKVIQLTHDRVTSLDAILSVLRDCERA